MLFATLTALLLPAAILAGPTTFSPRADEPCAPTDYTISDFILITSSTSAYVNFNFKSTFASTAGIEDSVIAGANCEADGPTLPYNNECNVTGRKLLFDLRAPQDQARYQITHTWMCGGKAWISGNDVTLQTICDTVDGVRTCNAGSVTFKPQNARQIPGGPGRT